MRKSRAEKLRKKLWLSDDISHEEIIDKESKIRDVICDSIKSIENDINIEEWNIQETLMKAVERWTDGDISSALNIAKSYHTNSKWKTEEKLNHTKRQNISKIFNQNNYSFST